MWTTEKRPRYNRDRVSARRWRNGRSSCKCIAPSRWTAPDEWPARQKPGEGYRCRRLPENTCWGFFPSYKDGAGPRGKSEVAAP